MMTTLCRACFAFASLLALLPVQLAAADSQSPVSIRFAAQVNGRDFACGQTFPDIGVSHSTIKPKDFRFFISAVRLVDAEGVEMPLTMEEGTKWQAQDVALLDFENGSGLCSNGTEETNDTIRGTVPTGHTWKALRLGECLATPPTISMAQRCKAYRSTWPMLSHSMWSKDRLPCFVGRAEPGGLVNVVSRSFATRSSSSSAT